MLKYIHHYICGAKAISVNYIYTINNFEKIFLEIIDNNETISSTRHLNRNIGKSFTLHLDKIGNLGEELRRRKLAEKQSHPWYKVESLTAELFMAYLATALGNLPSIKMKPITNEKHNLNIFKNIKTKNEETLFTLRDELMNGIFPVPFDPVSPREIVDFKEKFSYLLNDYRRHIESTLLLLISSGDDNKEVILERFRYDFTEQFNEIDARMKERRWSKISIWSICALASAGFCGIDAIINKNLISGIGSLFGICQAIGQGFQNNNLENAMDKFPLAYAVFAKKVFNDWN